MATAGWFGLGLEDCEAIREIEARHGNRPISERFDIWSLIFASPSFAYLFLRSLCADVGVLFHCRWGADSREHTARGIPAVPWDFCSVAGCFVAHGAK